MRVLQLGKFFPPVRGGIETATQALADGLCARGVEVDVLVAHTGWCTQRARATGGYGIVRAGSAGQLLSTSMAPRLPLELAAQAGRYDVVHVHMPDPLAAVAVWWARPRGHVVLHWHSDVVRQRLAMALYGPLQRWLLARADAVIATSEPYAEASEALRPWRHKVHVIPLGIAAPRPRLESARVAAFRSAHAGRRLVAALGRMTHYKGFDVLVDAAAALPADTRVLIAGAGEGLQALRARVDTLGLQDRVRLLGPLDDGDVPALLEAAELFCLPSTGRAEAFGLAMLEAMAMGRAVVCSSIPGSGVPWVSRDGETGLCVPPRDAAALAGALRRLLQDPALAARMGQAGRARFETTFQAAAMVDATLALYRSLAASR